jgi:hypothetical protein
MAVTSSVVLKDEDYIVKISLAHQELSDMKMNCPAIAPHASNKSEVYLLLNLYSVANART